MRRVWRRSATYSLVRPRSRAMGKYSGGLDDAARHLGRLVGSYNRPKGGGGPMSTARDWETRVAARIDRDELVDLTRRAVRFPTVNPPGDEAPLAEMLARALRREGIGVELISHGPARASLAARLRGSGQRAGLILTGHL